MKAKDVMKRKTEVEVKNTVEKLDDLILAGSITSSVYGMEDTPSDNWKLGWNLISMGPD